MFFFSHLFLEFVSFLFPHVPFSIFWLVPSLIIFLAILSSSCSWFRFCLFIRNCTFFHFYLSLIAPIVVLFLTPLIFISSFFLVISLFLPLYLPVNTPLSLFPSRFYSVSWLSHFKCFLCCWSLFCYSSNFLIFHSIPLYLPSYFFEVLLHYCILLYFHPCLIKSSFQMSKLLFLMLNCEFSLLPRCLCVKRSVLFKT